MTNFEEPLEWPPINAAYEGFALRMLDDLRWCAARLDALPDGPEVCEMREEMALLLADWTTDPYTYSNGTPVVLTIPPKRHLYNPPHRREEPGND